MHAPNTALAIYQSTSSAQDLINASPLRLELPSTGSSGLDTRSATFIDPCVDEPPAVEEDKFEQPDLNKIKSEPGASENTKEQAFGGLQKASATTDNSGIANWVKNWVTKESSTKSTEMIGPPKPSSQKHAPLNETESETELLKDSPSPASSPPSIREFQLTISPSVLNHQALIQRQHYYGSFKLDTDTIMGEDLERRVPVAGLADCQWKKGEAPLRIRKIWEDEANRESVVLMDLWREGRRMRGEV